MTLKFEELNFRNKDEYIDFLISFFKKNDFEESDYDNISIDLFYDGNEINYYNPEDFDDYEDFEDYAIDANDTVEYEFRKIIQDLRKKFNIKIDDWTVDTDPEYYDRVYVYL